MPLRWIICAVLLGGLVPGTEMFAERPPEDRSRATHVVVGTVEGVYVREEKDIRYYLVEIAVEKVEKGEGLKPGQAFYVGCYLYNPDYYKGKKLTDAVRRQLALRGAPYDGVPKEGERVRVYAKHSVLYANGRQGKYDGVYPDWYEVVKTK